MKLNKYYGGCVLDLSGSMVGCCEQRVGTEGGNSDKCQRSVTFSRKWG
jgi:hypothetical protein